MGLIDKDAILSKIDRLIDNGKYYEIYDYAFRDGNNLALNAIKEFINTLEVKKNNSWHLQSEEDIYDSFNDWNMHSFICLMNDETVREFTGILAECYDGSINKHIDCVDDDYDWEFDDIMYWIEMPLIEEKETGNENK